MFAVLYGQELPLAFKPRSWYNRGDYLYYLTFLTPALVWFVAFIVLWFQLWRRKPVLYAIAGFIAAMFVASTISAIFTPLNFEPWVP